MFELFIAEQLGVLTDGVQRLAQFVAGALIGIAVRQAVQQLDGFFAPLRQFALDACTVGAVVVPGRAARIEDAVEVRRTVLQFVDEEAEAGELMRQRFEFAVGHFVVRPGHFRNLRGAAAYQCHGVVLAEHAQRALDLLQRCGEVGEFGCARRIAEVAVELLFDLGQTGQDFVRDLSHEQAFLRTARHFVEQRDLHRWQGFAVACAHQAVDQRIHLRRQVFALRQPELFDQCVHDEQRGRDFHRQVVLVLQRIAAQPLADVEQRGSKPCEVGLADPRGGGHHGFALFVELRQADRRAGRESRPCILRVAQ